MKYDEMSVEQFVKATQTFRKGDKIGTYFVSKPDIEAYSAYAKAHKPEIMDYLIGKEQAEKQAAAARQAKIDGIEGLKEIEAAEETILNWREKFNRAMEKGDGILPGKPDVDLDSLYVKYPRAAAYRKAEAGSLASHYVKAGAYKKALERIINGEDYAQAIKDADAEWSAYCAEHIWD